MHASTVACRTFKDGEGGSCIPRQRQSAVCSECGAVHADGRWTWSDPPHDAQAVVCPACRCIGGQLAIGVVHISGGFEEVHRDQLTCIIRGHGAKAAAEHPQKRIVAIVTDASGILVTTTDVHLTRDLEAALRRAYNGYLVFRHDETMEIALA